MPWLFDEDEALKQKLLGFVTTNYPTGNHVPIQVYFRFPDPEERVRTFPHIAIDMVRIEFAGDRAHRANSFIQPIPTETATPSTGYNLVADDMPLPWNLIYQLRTFARTPWDDRFMQMMMFQLFPEGYGYLNMAAFDGTTRRADFVDAVRRDTLDRANKRVYSVVNTVLVSSEFYLNQIQTIQQVSTVEIQLDYIGSDLTETLSS